MSEAGDESGPKGAKLRDAGEASQPWDDAREKPKEDGAIITLLLWIVSVGCFAKQEWVAGWILVCVVLFRLGR